MVSPMASSSSPFMHALIGRGGEEVTQHFDQSLRHFVGARKTNNSAPRAAAAAN
jgi:hypothetical protein